jgi:hypothetical protein
MSSNQVPTAKWRLIAVELDSSLPRRAADKAHLYVSVCQSTPEERLIELQNGEGPETLVGTYRSLCQELLKRDNTYVLRRSAIAACRKEKKRLARRGHAINGSNTQWTTYVIDLDKNGVTGTDVGFVYVGQTSHTAEERFEIHKSEKPAEPARDLRSGVVHRRGLGLNYELMASLTPRPPVYTQEDALALEKIWAQKLEDMGYRVEAGDATPLKRVSPDAK